MNRDTRGQLTGNAIAEDMGKRHSVFSGRFFLFMLILFAFAFLFYQFGDKLSLPEIAAKETEWRKLQQQNPVIVLGVAFAVYVVVTGFSLPGATVLTLSYGWFFGFWIALPVVSFASTAGAICSFLLSRYIFRDAFIAKFGDRLNHFNRMLEQEGAFYLFTLRLIPAIPFFVINAVMGLTPIRLITYWLVSQVGMLPGTMVYIYFGSRIPSAEELANYDASQILKQNPGLFIAFVLLGLFPIAAKKMISRFRPSSFLTDTAKNQND